MIETHHNINLSVNNTYYHFQTYFEKCLYII